MKNIVMNINNNTKDNRIEIIFSERPSKAVRDAIKAINFVYRNIDGQTMWLCTAKYLDKDAYNDFIKTYCKDFKKVVTQDGKAAKKTETKTETKKPAPKKTTTKKAETKQEAPKQADDIAMLKAQIEALTKAVEALTKASTPAPKQATKKTETKAKPKLEAKTKVIDNSNANAPKTKTVLTVNGKVVR